MSIEVNFKKTYIVNGKEYNSIDEMPDDIRQALEKASSEKQWIKISGNSSITFNGKIYKNTEAMPPAERLSYEEVMKAADPGNLGRTIEKSLTSPAADFNNPLPKALTFEASFSPRSLILVAALIILALVAYLYFIIHEKTSPK